MVNLCILMGRLGKDPELKYSTTGTAICKFSLATSEYYKQGNETKERTVWHNISCFGKTAENCNKFLHKGSVVHVTGKIDNKSYEKDGKKLFYSEVIAQEVRFVDKGEKKEIQNQSVEPTQEFKIDTNPAYTCDNIPF